MTLLYAEKLHSSQIQKEESKNKKLITKTKRTNEQRNGDTSCESPSPRPIKLVTTERSEQLVSQTIHILKCTSILFPPYVHHIKHNGTKFQISDKCFPK